MKLTQDQITQLYAFTRQHFVEHYDLQTELVDHLANGIEELQKLNPKLTFDTALQMEFKKFGVFGFADVIKEKTNAMEKRYWKIILRFYKEYFRLPRILRTATSILLLAFLLGLVPIEHKYNIIIGLFFIIVWYVLLRFFIKRKDHELEMIKNGKKWMLKDQIYSFGHVANIINLFPIILNFSFFRDRIPMNSTGVDFVFATTIISLIVLTYTVIHVLPKKAEALLSEAYPEYEMV